MVGVQTSTSSSHEEHSFILLHCEVKCHNTDPVNGTGNSLCHV